MKGTFFFLVTQGWDGIFEQIQWDRSYTTLIQRCTSSAILTANLPLGYYHSHIWTSSSTPVPRTLPSVWALSGLNKCNKHFSPSTGVIFLWMPFARRPFIRNKNACVRYSSNVYLPNMVAIFTLRWRAFTIGALSTK